MAPKWARLWFGATAACAVAGIIISVFTAAHNSSGYFRSPVERAFNSFAFFTILSNLIVAGTALLLALQPLRESFVFCTARLTGVVCITVTGVVYHVALARLLDLDSWDLAGDQLVHTVVPALTVAGWLMFGPRRTISARTARWSLTFPIAWLVFTLIRGAVVGFYPYPFVDASMLGYFKTLLNCLWVAVLFLGIAGAAKAIDGRLARLSSPMPTSDAADDLQ